MLPATAVPGLRQAVPAAWKRYSCVHCRRSLSTSPAVASGHNRWSKIRHEKGAADLKKTALRTNMTRTLTLYSQMYGADVSLNPQLATIVQNAKKAGVPKTTIEAAIARGQGRSAAGAKLHSVTCEFMMPPSVAIVVDVETESKAHALQELNAMIKRKGGTLTPTKFFFTHTGRVVLGAADSAEGEAVSADDVLEDAIEAGAEDVESDADGNIVVWTPPVQTGPVVASVEKGPFKERLSILSAETVWAANDETRAPLDHGLHGQSATDQRKLHELVVALRATPDVKAVYSNVAQGEATDEYWQQLEQELDW